MNESHFDESETASTPYGLADPKGMIARRWFLMFTTMLAVAMATAAYIRFKEPRYAAEATILIATQRISEEYVRNTNHEDLYQRLNAMMSEVLSKRKIVQIVEKHGLYARLRDTYTLGDIVEMTRSDISISLDSPIGQTRNSNARLLRLNFVAEDPQTAALVANEIAGMLTAEAIRTKTEGGLFTKGADSCSAVR